MVNKPLNIHNKERVVKASVEKDQVTSKGMPLE